MWPFHEGDARLRDVYRVEFQAVAIGENGEVDAGVDAFIDAILLVMSGLLECAPLIGVCAVIIAGDRFEGGDGLGDGLAFGLRGFDAFFERFFDAAPFFFGGRDRVNDLAAIVTAGLEATFFRQGKAAFAQVGFERCGLHGAGA